MMIRHHNHFHLNLSKSYLHIMRKIINYIIILFLPLINIRAQEVIVTQDTGKIMSMELDEVVIKASKDNVTHKTIPASVSVISSDIIEGNEIKTLNEVTGTVPNFFMPDYGSKLTSPVYIRGIGSRINSPSVGLYVDYVPYFEKAAFDFDFFDIKSIEVLRGPQGTLFGRNTMGGIVNIVTTSPLDYQGNHINLSAGNYGTYSLNGGHYGKTGKLAYSLALNMLHNDGFYTNEYSGSKVDKLNSYGFRNRIIYELSDRFSIENIAGFESSKQGGYPYAVFNDSLKSAERINYNQYSSYDRNLFSDALLLRYTGNNFELMSTSSYQYLADLQNIDQDFTVDSLFFISQRQNQNMVSQEVVARSSGNQVYKWLFGGYAWFQEFNNAVNVDAWAQKMDYLKKYDHKISGGALFHQSSISPFSNLTLTAGIRIDFEKDVMDYYYDRTLRGNYAVLADTIYPSLVSMEIIPRVAASYRFKKSNFYVVAARGYKTGGFNSTFERPEDLTFDPEYSWNYETGVKTSFFNNSLYADFAVFYIDWKNQQIYQTVPSGRGSMLKNAGHSVSKGTEISLRATPLKGFEFMLSYGYTEAKFISYNLNDSVNYNNNFLPYVPRHTVSFQASKSLNIKNSGILDKIKISALYRGAGEIFWNEENSASQPYYSLVDAKISFIRKALQLDLWTKNMLNTDYSSFYFEALGKKYVQTGKPAQIGMNLSIKF
jgi:iron complex outermembrane recepter protein